MSRRLLILAIIAIAAAVTLPLAHAACDNPDDSSSPCDPSPDGDPGTRAAVYSMPYEVFNYRWEDNPGDSRLTTRRPADSPYGAYVPGGSNKARMQSDNIPLTRYLAGAINPCAYEGRLVSAGFDDEGWVSISGSDARNDGCGGASNSKSGNGVTFDPQTATVAWFINNRCDGPSGIWARVEISYRSQQGHIWDGRAKTCTRELPNITGLRVSDAAPKENQVITLWCQSSIAGIDMILPASNQTGVTFTPGEWTDDEQAFTFNVKQPGHQNITCRIGKDDTTVKNLTIRVAALPAGDLGVASEHKCVEGTPTINITWRGIAGAASYNVSVNGTVQVVTIPHADGMLFRATPFAEVTPKDILTGRPYNWTVTALDASGAPVKAENTTISYAPCTQPAGALTIPDRFTRAHFARTGSRNVTAFWTERGVTVIYANFVTDFSSIKPEVAQYSLAGGNRQIVAFDPADEGAAAEYWQRYVRALRVDNTVTGTPVGLALRGVQGYNATPPTTPSPDYSPYDPAAAWRGEYLKLWGRFAAGGNKVYLNAVEVTPDYQDGTQINVPLPSEAPTGAVQVSVESDGVRTNAMPFTIR